MSSKNDRIVLNEIITQRKAEIDPASTDSDYFELFAAEQILKDYDLGYEELESGLVGDGGDGGIDGIYLFINDELVTEDPDYGYLRKNIELRLELIQAKTSSGFEETPIERFLTASDDIFDLSKDTNDLQGVYNTRLLEVIERFRVVHKQVAARFPKIHVSFYYASKGDRPSSSVERKARKLETVVVNYFPQAIVSTEFVGAAELLARARRQPQTVYEIPLAENPISLAGQVGFACLVTLRDFYEFISEKGHIRRPIFEGNVRDYQGRTEVNDAIQDTLQSNRLEDFWWLNNGVTILAGRASQAGKTLTVEDPQIVNGLQTSTEIFNYFEKYRTDDDDRTVLVRILVPEESESRDRIIKATNSQTKVTPASLRATDKVHRDIEDYLRPKGLFYDRRKNFYKNEGKPREKIVSIPYLAQAVMAILLKQPDTARARPSSLLKKDEDYLRVYNTDYPVGVYHACAVVMRSVEKQLRAEDSLPTKDRNNLRFYVAMEAVRRALAPVEVSPATLAHLDPSEVREAHILEALCDIRTLYMQLGADDQVAKGPTLLAKLTGDFASSVG